MANENPPNANLADDVPLRALFDLTGQVCLVTGGAGWLGTAMSRALAEAGGTVVVTSRSAERATARAASLPGPAPHAGVALDLSDPTSIDDCVAAAVRSRGQIDVLVNNGYGAAGGRIAETSAEDFARSYAVGVTGQFLIARAVRDHLVERRATGSIINIASMYGVVGSYPEVYEGLPTSSPANYHAVKGAIVQLTRHLAVYWARDRVRVNAISPGPFPRSAAQAIPMLTARLENKSPMGRLGQPWELKGAVVFLASAASSYVTGHNLVVDGGWTAW